MSSWNSSTPRPSVQEETGDAAAALAAGNDLAGASLRYRCSLCGCNCADANPHGRCAHVLAEMLRLSAERRQAGEALPARPPAADAPPRSHPPYRYVRDGDGAECEQGRLRGILAVPAESRPQFQDAVV